jgi:nicotinamidase-related amidase
LSSTARPVLRSALEVLVPVRNSDLHGYVPDKCDTALILIDVINALDFPEGKQVLPAALKMAARVAALKLRARRAGIPSVYVNDNFGRWRSDFHTIIKRCLRRNALGRPIVERLIPRRDDYFVLKPKHSGFYSTTLDTLLQYLQVKSVILTGIAANNCVLFTANDAYMRDLAVKVPRDCVVSNTEQENRYALGQMQRVLKADIRPSAQLVFRRRRKH